MNITVYIQDELGAKAKEAGLPMSALFQKAVTGELERRRAVEVTESKANTYEVDMVDEEGRRYTGRIIGTRMAEGHRGEQVYLGEDERVLVYDPNTEGQWQCYEVEDAEEDLRQILDHEEYLATLSALGIKPTIDLY